MKAADAKAPKFDSLWWLQNKSPRADTTGKFADALKEYETARDGLIKIPSVPTLAALGTKLNKLVQLAKTTKADSKLTPAQKESKEALATYEKLGAAALARVVALARDAEIVDEVPDLVKRDSKALRDYCKKEFATENLDFLTAMMKGQKNRETFELYIPQGAPKQINVSNELREPLVAWSTRIKDTGVPDTPAIWAKAPWDKAITEVVKVLTTDTLVRYRKAYIAAKLKAVALP